MRFIIFLFLISLLLSQEVSINNEVAAQTKVEEKIEVIEPQLTEETSYFSTSPFLKGFSIILVSEIGDKTFLIAAILSITNPRLQIFLAASSALLIMTILSALLGLALPSLFSPKYTKWMAALLFFVFGVKMIWDATKMKGDEVQEEMEEVEEEMKMKKLYKKSEEEEAEEGELHKKEEEAEKNETILNKIENLMQFLFTPIFVQTFVMTFLAEWGDRSQISTIALGASENIFWVTFGATLAHILCTGAACLGGRLLASKISAQTVTFIGGLMFICFSLWPILMPDE